MTALSASLQRTVKLTALLAAVLLAAPATNAAKPAKKTVRVKAGQSIQDAVDSVDGDAVILVEPGTYHETVMIDFEGITLRGIETDGRRPILDGQGKLNDAVVGSGDNFLMEGFRIVNYKGNGVVYSGAKNITFRDLVVRNAGLYGLYPVTSQNVLIERCIASEISDAGIYAGQCKDVVVRDCEAYNNVAGIEIENCVNSLVTNNSAHDNTGGIIVFVMPNLPSKIGKKCKVVRNRVHHNNHVNFAKPGTAVYNVLPGSGIGIMAADETIVTENEIWENNTTGISVVNWYTAYPERKVTDIEPNSDGSRIFNNEFKDNGLKPAKEFVKLGFKGVDLFWDGTGKDNGWNENTTKTIPPELPPIPSGKRK